MEPDRMSNMEWLSRTEKLIGKDALDVFTSRLTAQGE